VGGEAMLQIFNKEEKRKKEKKQKDFLVLCDFGELYYLD